MCSVSLPASRSGLVVARLRDEILRGLLPPGALLAEAAVAQRLGVSRVPVREALFVLENEGLVEFSETGRAYVYELMPHDFEELLVVRLTLEPAAAKLAVTAIRRDASLLEQNIKATSQAKSIHEVTQHDLDFHELIIAASGNVRLLKLWCSMRGQLELWLGQLHRQHQIETLKTRQQTVKSHRKILEYLRKKPAGACEREMRQHILGWRKWLPLPLEEVSA